MGNRRRNNILVYECPGDSIDISFAVVVDKMP